MSARAEVYWNLHRNRLSLRPIGGRVEHHDAVLLKDVTLAVQPAGRERVLRERRKNVHAFVRGTVAALDEGVAESCDGWERVTYNPYKAATFVTIDGRPVFTAAKAIIRDKAIYVLREEGSGNE